MSITDELRERIDAVCRVSGLDCKRLTEIADRIDAEYEAKVSYWQGASYKDGYDEGFASADDWCAQHEDAMNEHGWVKLPKDVDGEPIHIGDLMEWVPYDSSYPSVIRKVVAVGVCVFFAWSDEKQGYAQYEALAYRHHPAPTVEDVLREFTDAILEWSKKSGTIAETGTWSEVADEYAAKLRLAGSDAE